MSSIMPEDWHVPASAAGAARPARAKRFCQAGDEGENNHFNPFDSSNYRKVYRECKDYKTMDVETRRKKLKECIQRAHPPRPGPALWKKEHDEMDPDDVAVELYSGDVLCHAVEQALLSDDLEHLRAYGYFFRAFNHYIVVPNGRDTTLIYRGTSRHAMKGSEGAGPTDLFRQPTYVSCSEDHKVAMAMGDPDCALFELVVPAGSMNAKPLRSANCKHPHPEDQEWTIPPYTPVKFLKARTEWGVQVITLEVLDGKAHALDVQTSLIALTGSTPVQATAQTAKMVPTVPDDYTPPPGAAVKGKDFTPPPGAAVKGKDFTPPPGAAVNGEDFTPPPGMVLGGAPSPHVPQGYPSLTPPPAGGFVGGPDRAEALFTYLKNMKPHGEPLIPPDNKHALEQLREFLQQFLGNKIVDTDVATTIRKRISNMAALHFLKKKGVDHDVANSIAQAMQQLLDTGELRDILQLSEL